MCRVTSTLLRTNLSGCSPSRWPNRLLIRARFSAMLDFLSSSTVCLKISFTFYFRLPLSFGWSNRTVYPPSTYCCTSSYSNNLIIIYTTKSSYCPACHQGTIYPCPNQITVKKGTSKMLASRSVKPKLSLSISTTTSQARPSLSLKSPMAPPRTPISPSPISPTARNTRLNQRGYSVMQQPSYAYANSTASRSILKKGQSAVAGSRKLQFSEKPTVHCVTPIEDESYYGEYRKMSKEERRWQKK